ncbi:MAG: Major outer membrane porin [Chlamydiales bacterium]|nr:Major outer membrane porin [Chlamydiales bacterium]MCH9620507.1 Major outer membrane porin [Chlamydiales bacterium]MCH9623492.1 Major outer membrane porin [Chlamydiales bacterium]
MLRYLVFFTIFNVSLAALPLGNPWNAALFCDGAAPFTDCLPPACNWIDARVGFSGDYVSNRHLKSTDRNNNEHSIHDFSINTNAGKVTLNFCERVNVYGIFGASNCYIQTPTGAFSPSLNDNQTVYIHTASDFAWGIGGAGTIWQCGSFALGGEGNYFYTKPSITMIEVFRSSIVATYANLASIKYQEWQFGLGATYQFCLSQTIQALPFIGLTWSNAWVNMGKSIEPISAIPNPSFTLVLNPLKSQRLWGYAVGLTLAGCDRFQLTLEKRFASENAINLNAEFKF